MLYVICGKTTVHHESRSVLPMSRLIGQLKLVCFPVCPHAFNNLKSFGRNLVILHTALLFGVPRHRQEATWGTEANLLFSGM